MIPIKKSFGLIKYRTREITEFRLSIGIILLTGLFCLLLGQPNLALGAPQQPPAPVIAAIRQDLSQKTQISPSQFKVKTATAKTWPDGCLGLAKPEEFCTQSLVQGWQVTITNDQKTWIYRTDNTGRNLRLEK